MYGQPLKPNRASFEFFEDEGEFTIHVSDLDDPSNDDVRDVDHPDWDTLWGNEMENVFSPWDQDTVRNGFYGDKPSDLQPLTNKNKARAWLLSIGMTEVQEDN